MHGLGVAVDQHIAGQVVKRHELVAVADRTERVTRANDMQPRRADNEALQLSEGFRAMQRPCRVSVISTPVAQVHSTTVPRAGAGGFRTRGRARTVARHTERYDATPPSRWSPAQALVALERRLLRRRAWAMAAVIDTPSEMLSRNASTSDWL